MARVEGRYGKEGGVGATQQLRQVLRVPRYGYVEERIVSHVDVFRPAGFAGPAHAQKIAEVQKGVGAYEQAATRKEPRLREGFVDASLGGGTAYNRPLPRQAGV